MRSFLSVTLVLVLVLVLLLTLTAGVVTSQCSVMDSRSLPGGKHEKSRPESDCGAAETLYGKCVPEDGDCGDGLRDATCKDKFHKIHCRIPCNWKKDISDCKYRFGPWGPCDGATNTKSRSGTLKRALFNAECQTTVKVSKPCSPKVKKTRGEKKAN